MILISISFWNGVDLCLSSHIWKTEWHYIMLKNIKNYFPFSKRQQKSNKRLRLSDSFTHRPRIAAYVILQVKITRNAKHCECHLSQTWRHGGYLTHSSVYHSVVRKRGENIKVEKLLIIGIYDIVVSQFTHQRLLDQEIPFFY